MAYSKTTWVDDSAPYINATNLNNLENGVEAIATTLGANPAGEYATVAARLAALELRVQTLEIETPPDPGVPYGPAFNLDQLQNTVLGGPTSRMAASTFRSPVTADLDQIHIWLKTASGGYGGGTGGSIKIQVESDNGGIPSGTPLSSATTVNAPDYPNSDFPDVVFTTPASLTAGTLYHLTFENVDASPAVNYTSLNNTTMSTMPVSGIYQPRWPDNSFDALAKDGAGAWYRFYNSTPICEFTFSDATIWGQSYYDYTPLSAAPTISGDLMVREYITVSGGNKQVTGVALRLAQTLTNTGTDPLVARLETGAGALIESVDIDITGVPSLNLDSNGSAGIWVEAAFSQTHTLTSGSVYVVRFSTEATTQLRTRPIKQGTGTWGFDASGASGFPDGVAEFSSNGGSTWGSIPSFSTNADLQMYLTTPLVT